MLHEVCHWLVTPPDRRGTVNWGLGPDASVTHARNVDWDACEARADALAATIT